MATNTTIKYTLGSIPSIETNFAEEIFFYVAVESDQWLKNDDQIHLALASGKVVA